MSDYCSICQNQISFFQKKYQCSICSKTICKIHLSQVSQKKQKICTQCVKQKQIDQMKQDLEDHQIIIKSDLELAILMNSRRDREISDLNSQLNFIKQQVSMIDSQIKETDLKFYSQIDLIQENTNKSKDIQEMYKVQLKHSQENIKQLAQKNDLIHLELVEEQNQEYVQNLEYKQHEKQLLQLNRELANLKQLLLTYSQQENNFQSKTQKPSRRTSEKISQSSQSYNQLLNEESHKTCDAITKFC